MKLSRDCRNWFHQFLRNEIKEPAENSLKIKVKRRSIRFRIIGEMSWTRWVLHDTIIQQRIVFICVLKKWIHSRVDQCVHVNRCLHNSLWQWRPIELKFHAQHCLISISVEFDDERDSSTDGWVVEVDWDATWCNAVSMSRNKFQSSSSDDCCIELTIRQNNGTTNRIVWCSVINNRKIQQLPASKEYVLSSRMKMKRYESNSVSEYRISSRKKSLFFLIRNHKTVFHIDCRLLIKDLPENVQKTTSTD